MIRSVAAVLVGLLAAAVVITLVETVGLTIFAPPAGIDPMTPEGMSRIVAQMSPAALLFVLLAYVAGGLAGGAVAARISRGGRAGHALAVGAMLAVGALFNVVTIPHPLWMSVASVAIPIPSAWLGARLAGPRQT